MDLLTVIKDSNNRIAAEDLELLQGCCRLCDAKTILEIGSADGGSSVVLGTAAKDNGGHLYCIEIKPKQRMVNNMTKYGLDGFYTIIPAASPWVPDKLLPDSIDLLFIDGCHDVRWALVDYHYFEPYVRKDGIIIFHDTSGHCQEDRRQANYNKNGYIPQVQRAIDIILETDKDRLVEVGRSNAPMGGAIAFRKTLI